MEREESSRTVCRAIRHRRPCPLARCQARKVGFAMRIITVRFVSTPPEALSRPRGPRMKRLYRHGGRKMSLRCTLLVPTCKRCAASGFLARSNNGMHHAPQCMLAPSAVASVLRSNLHELKASGLLGFLLVCFLPIGQYAGTTLRSKQSPF